MGDRMELGAQGFPDRNLGISYAPLLCPSLMNVMFALALLPLGPFHSESLSFATGELEKSSIVRSTMLMVSTGTCATFAKG